MQSTVAGWCRSSGPMIAPLTPAPAERMATIAIRLKAGASRVDQGVGERRPSNQMTISPSLKIAQTAPVMVANSDRVGLVGVVEQELGDLGAEGEAAGPIVTAEQERAPDDPDAERVGRARCETSSSAASSSSSTSSSSSATPKVRMIVPGFESQVDDLGDQAGEEEEQRVGAERSGPRHRATTGIEA